MNRGFYLREILWRAEGQGKIISASNTIPCSFGVFGLVNGRLRLEIIVPETHSNVATQFVRQGSPVRLTAHDTNNYELDIPNISVSNIRHHPSNSTLSLIAYPASVVRRITVPQSIYSMRAELTNLHPLGPHVHIPLAIDEGTITLQAYQLPHRLEMLEHGYAFQHAIVDGQVVINSSIPLEPSTTEQIFQNLSFLLSVARRGYVSIVGVHCYDQDSRLLSSSFSEPPFQGHGISTPLIRLANLAEFIESSHSSLIASCKKWNLHSAIDHYLQLMITRSAWPLAVSAFAAIESLNSAYRHQRAVGPNPRTYMPKRDFRVPGGLLSEIESRLFNAFGRSLPLTREDKEYLNNKIQGLNFRPWSFKEQLTGMLDSLSVPYDDREIDTIYALRNLIIHSGTPISSQVSPDDFNRIASERWQEVRSIVALFEKALLSILTFSGKRTLFNEVAEGEVP